MRRVWWALALLLLAGCEGDALLVVSLRTDLVGGLEVTRAATVVDDGAAMESASLAAGEDLVGGRRIAELSVAPGRRRVTVELSGPDGFVARRTLLVDVRGATAVTAVITRSCRGVMCPEASDAAATECLGGVCVPPECTPETPEFCPVAECEAAADCASGPMCTAPVCLGGACGLRADASACEGGVCDPDEGCVDGPAPDAGPPRDAGLPDSGLPDGGLGDSGPTDSGLPDTGPPDAGPDPGCVAACPGRCEGDLCVLDGTPGETACPPEIPCEFRCLGFTSCSSGLTCADGPCRFRCEGPGSCAGELLCGSASRCDVTCSGSGACDGVIRCGSGRCDVDCVNDNTCLEVGCGAAPADIECSAPGACSTVTCRAPSPRLDLLCMGFGACNDVTCSASVCAIDCSGTSCGSVNCSAACDCDVTCAGLGTCSSVECPTACASGRGCRSDGTPACACL
ncbi:MAG: hypothetical protein VYE22_29795 [Myxococcota bacterium]|nr:hypothetical protein [Myxococcota bacterium]